MKPVVKSLSFGDMLKQVLTGERECLHSPDAPVETGEVVLGTLDDPIAQAAWSFMVELSNGLRKFQDELPSERPEDKKSLLDLQIHHHQVSNRHRCAHDVFWELVSRNSRRLVIRRLRSVFARIGRS